MLENVGNNQIQSTVNSEWAYSWSCIIIERIIIIVITALLKKDLLYGSNRFGSIVKLKGVGIIHAQQIEKR